MISAKLFNQVAQMAHVGWAALIVLVFNLYGYMWIGVVGMLVFGYVKEFWYDQKYEDAEVRGSSEEDFLFYCLGIASGFAFVVLKVIV